MKTHKGIVQYRRNSESSEWNNTGNIDTKAHVFQMNEDLGWTKYRIVTFIQ